MTRAICLVGALTTLQKIRDLKNVEIKLDQWDGLVKALKNILKKLFRKRSRRQF